MNLFIQKSLVIASCIIGTLVILAALFVLFYRLFLRNRVEKHYAIKYRIDVEDIFHSLEIIIANEIIIYERYLTNSTDIEIGTALTNAQFVNIYNDLSKRVLTALTPTFYTMAEIYLTKAELQTYVTQRIYNYLAEKVANNDPMALGASDDDDYAEE